MNCAAASSLKTWAARPYLVGLLNVVPTSVNARTYAQLVEAASTRRQLLAAAGTIADLAYDEAEDIATVIDRSEQTLFGVSEKRTTRDLVSVRHIAQDYLERVEELHRRGEDIIGVPTGFNDLDRLLGGLNRSDLIIVAARPGMGKTSLQISMALTAARRYDKRVAMFSLEMSGEQLVQRMIAAETRIDSQRLRRGASQPTRNGRSSCRRSVVFPRRHILSTIRPRFRRCSCAPNVAGFYSEHGIDLIMIDYLQLMQAEYRTNNRVQEISDISRGLKQLARETGCAGGGRGAAQPRRGAAAGQTAVALRPARQWQHRTGRRRRHVHLSR